MKILQRTLTWRLWRMIWRPSLDVSRYVPIVGEAPTLPRYVLLLEFVGLLLVVPMIVFTSTIYGIAWAVNIANVIGRERARGTFDHLSVCPGGGLEASLGVMLTVLHNTPMFASITSRNSLTGRVVIVSVVLFMVMRGPIADTDDLGQVALLAVYIAICAGALIVDHIQSIILSSMVGLTTPFISRNPLDAPLFAFLSFLTLQVCIYLLTSLVTLVVSELLPYDLFRPDYALSCIVVAVGFMFLVGIRAGIIAVLWWTLTWQVNGDPAELA